MPTRSQRRSRRRGAAVPVATTASTSACCTPDECERYLSSSKALDILVATSVPCLPQGSQIGRQKQKQRRDPAHAPSHIALQVTWPGVRWRPFPNANNSCSNCNSHHIIRFVSISPITIYLSLSGDPGGGRDVLVRTNSFPRGTKPPRPRVRRRPTEWLKSADDQGADNGCATGGAGDRYEWHAFKS